jgi:hypothetical protein
VVGPGAELGPVGAVGPDGGLGGVDLAAGLSAQLLKASQGGGMVGAGQALLGVLTWGSGARYLTIITGQKSTLLDPASVRLLVASVGWSSTSHTLPRGRRIGDRLSADCAPPYRGGSTFTDHAGGPSSRLS